MKDGARWIQKAQDQGLVFGWANVSVEKGAIVTDSQDEQIEPEVLERAMYGYAAQTDVRELVKRAAAEDWSIGKLATEVEKRGAGGELHEGDAPNRLVELVYFDPDKVEAMFGGPEATAIITADVAKRLADTGGDRDEVLEVLKDAIGVRAWIGQKVPPATAAKVKRGELAMWSIEGTATEVPA